MLRYVSDTQEHGRQIPPIFYTLREIDEILLKVEQVLVASRSHSPFNIYLTQLTPEQTRIVTDGLGELRTAMLCLARREGIRDDAPMVNTALAIRRSLQAASAKLADAPPILDDAHVQRHGKGLDDPGRLLMQMKDVFRRLDRELINENDPALKEHAS